MEMILRRDEIKERLRKTTPGPWGTEDHKFEITPDDFSFICHAREDVPALLKEIERLEVMAEVALQAQKRAEAELAEYQRIRRRDSRRFENAEYKEDTMDIWSLTEGYLADSRQKVNMES